VTTAAVAILLAAGAGFVFRLLRGPTLADRVMGIDGLVLAGMAGIAIHAVRTGSGAFLPVLVVLTLVGFVGTAIVARFIEADER
jgi:multisubunit Na+/H+ antiporter MnhF subunit